ncbi:MAG: hypothetical protein OEY14_05295 [Myxococcales bacterium]|nr:hypothetical protein [Myxococcales bacterium]
MASRRHLEGLTLVEVALVVCLLGVALAVFVPTFARELRISKIAEAPEELERLHQRAAAYFEVVFETDLGRMGHCLPEAAGPTPLAPTQEPEVVDFLAEEVEDHASWEALGFQPERPLRYSYRFIPAQHGCGISAEPEATLLTLRAEGDLDGDGSRSVFERNASIGEDGRLRPNGMLYVTDRVE